MNEQIQHALETGRTIDITTYGRKTGQPRRIETWFHNLDGTIYLTGSPGKRDWYANLVANPDFIFHLTQEVVADLPARATPITDPAQRREVMSRILTRLNLIGDLEQWIKESPLASVVFTNGTQTAR